MGYWFDFNETEVKQSTNAKQMVIIRDMGWKRENH